MIQIIATHSKMGNSNEIIMYPKSTWIKLATQKMDFLWVESTIRLSKSFPISGAKLSGQALVEVCCGFECGVKWGKACEIQCSSFFLNNKKEFDIPVWGCYHMYKKDLMFICYKHSKLKKKFLPKTFILIRHCFEFIMTINDHAIHVSIGQSWDQKITAMEFRSSGVASS